jgi:hypothetical protein
MSSAGSSQTNDASALPVISATFLTGVTLALLVPRAEVEARVALASESLRSSERLRLDDAGLVAGARPVLIDIWQLAQGRLELGGLTQHEWSELAYGALGGAFGLAIGALRGATGAVRGTSRNGAGKRVERAAPAWRQVLSATTQAGLRGMGSGVSTLAGFGRRVSESSARSLGNYTEVMFSIPGVHVVATGQPSLAARPFTLSLGVYTDSMPACSIDRNFRYGLGKVPATIEFGSSESTQLVRVIDELGRETLSVAVRPLERCGRLPPDLTQWFGAPLLGIHPRKGANGTAAARRSSLRRHFDSAVLRKLTCQLRLPFGPFGLPSGNWLLTDGCVCYDKVWSEITLPGDAS